MKNKKPKISKKMVKKVKGGGLKKVLKKLLGKNKKQVKKPAKKMAIKKVAKVLKVKVLKKSVKKVAAKKGFKAVKSNKKSVSKKTAIKKVKPVKAVKASKTGKKIKAVKVVKQAPVKEAAPAGLKHVSVMLKEALDGLSLKGKKNIVDCTLGLGGHAREILMNLPKTGKLIGFDLDNNHLEAAKKNLKEFKDQVLLVHDNFSNLAESLKNLKIKTVDAVLMDLGLASPHVDQGERGFSFLHEGPLDMRFNQDQQLTAEEVINKYSEKELMRIFFEYGEERWSRKIAREICQARRRKPFKTTGQLADFIEKLVGRQGHIHPATRVFQALRIEVNKELDALHKGLDQAIEVLKPGGRIVVISYHSLEDRIVKNMFRDNSRDYINLPDQPTTTVLIPKLKIITKKPLEPSEEEVKQNPRSRSAKLRIAEKL